jgi:hypothetical protein
MEDRCLSSKPANRNDASSRPVSLFGKPQLLGGEDVDQYEELLARFRIALNPVDVVGEMLIADAVPLEWEILRYRRLKTSLLRSCQLKTLESFLRTKLDYHLCLERFAELLTEIVQEHGPEDQADNFASTVVKQYMGDDPDAIEEIDKILAARADTVDPSGVARLDKLLGGDGSHSDDIWNLARADKAKEIAREFFKQQPNAILLVDKLLADAATSLDALVADTLLANMGTQSGAHSSDYLQCIERLDHLITVAEGRRNAALREIDRRRPVLGQALRQTVQEIEGSELKVIETTPIEEKTRA